MNYRADIQILRGISVLLVIIYHLQLGVIKSGFLGVDVFFVISGFLMAILYTPSMPSDKHNAVWDFWARRARRILPAYFITILATLLIGFFLLYPAEYHTLIKHSLYSNWLLPNFAFWLENNYFDAQSFRPLLHFWSLGIEVQFYLIVPIVFWLLRRSVKWLIAAAVVSFLLSYLLGGRSPNSAFFLLGTRFWEFMCGFFCAYYLTNSGHPKHQKTSLSAAAMIGLLILCCIDFGIGLRHPGFIALLACLLACTVLTLGAPPKLIHSPLGKALEYTGKLSYSLYLVHYPIILFVLYSPFQGALFSEAQYSHILAALALTVVSSMALYHWVESPLRKPNHLTSSAPRFALSLLFIMSACSVIALGLNTLQRAKYDAQELAIFDSTHNRDTFRCGEIFNVTHLFSFSCSLTNNEKTAQKRYLLVGNSHADAIKTTLANLAKQHNSSLRITRHNFALGAQENTPENILREIKKYDIDAVINHSSPSFINLDALQKLSDMAKDHDFEIHHIDPMPTWNSSVPRSLWLEHIGDAPAEQKNYGYYRKQNYLEQYILSKADPNVVTRYNPGRYLCKPLCQTINAQGQAFYYDSHHLTLVGSMALRPMFTQIFNPTH